MISSACASWWRSRAFSRSSRSRSGYPDRFASYEDAHGWCRRFFPWYNREHRHSALGYLTPEGVHSGRAPAALAARAEVLRAAYAAHPERFVRRPPQPSELPPAVWINPPARNDAPGCPRIDDLDPVRSSGTPLTAGQVAVSSPCELRGRAMT